MRRNLWVEVVIVLNHLGAVKANAETPWDHDTIDTVVRLEQWLSNWCQLANRNVDLAFGIIDTGE